MGANLKRWAITLALLNVRLGFWFPNPKFVKRHSLKLSALRITNLYLLSEMFGILKENRPFLYLTDGGHIENLGLYQLLRRRCRLIVVIDAEADPKMAFNSLIKAARYARIDLGTRIELPWYKIRDTTLQVNRVIADKGDAGHRGLSPARRGQLRPGRAPVDLLLCLGWRQGPRPHVRAACRHLGRPRHRQRQRDARRPDPVALR